MNERWRAWGPAVAWAAVLFALSASPMRLSGDGWWSQIDDKAVHLCLYVVLGAALAWARMRGARGMPHAVMIAVGALYGASDEWHQSFVPNRTASVADWAADVAGVLLGYGLIIVAAAWLARRAHDGTDERTT